MILLTVGMNPLIVMYFGSFTEWLFSSPWQVDLVRKRVFDATVLKGDVFAPLNDPAVFNNFKIVHGVITWMNEEIDCAPEYMYENSYEYLDMEAVV